MEARSKINVLKQEVFRSEPEKFPLGDALRGTGAHVELKPALDQLPRQLVGDFEILHDPATNGLLQLSGD